VAQVAVVGAGAIGSAVAGLLAAAGADVALVGRSPEHILAIARHGLYMDQSHEARKRVRLRATADPAAVGPCGHVVIATKAYDTVTAAKTARPLIDGCSWVTTIQNGLGNDAVLARAFGADRVLPGVTMIGAERRGPGLVFLSDMTAAGQAEIAVGPPRVPGATMEGGAALREVMAVAGIPVTVTEAIDMVIWRKLASTAIGPVASLLGSTVGQAWNDAELRPILERLHGEVVMVAQAEGVRLELAASWRHVAAHWAGAGDNRPSMSVDLTHGRRTEIDSTLGEVVRRARVHDLPVPTAEVVVRLLRSAEQRAVRR